MLRSILQGYAALVGTRFAHAIVAPWPVRSPKGNEERELCLFVMEGYAKGTVKHGCPLMVVSGKSTNKWESFAYYIAGKVASTSKAVHALCQKNSMFLVSFEPTAHQYIDVHHVFIISPNTACFSSLSWPEVGFGSKCIVFVLGI